MGPKLYLKADKVSCCGKLVLETLHKNICSQTVCVFSEGADCEGADEAGVSAPAVSTGCCANWESKRERGESDSQTWKWTHNNNMKIFLVSHWGNWTCLMNLGLSCFKPCCHLLLVVCDTALNPREWMFRKSCCYVSNCGRAEWSCSSRQTSALVWDLLPAVCCGVALPRRTPSHFGWLMWVMFSLFCLCVWTWTCFPVTKTPNMATGIHVSGQ